MRWRKHLASLFLEIREAGFDSDVLLVSLLNEKSACPAIAGFFLSARKSLGTTLPGWLADYGRDGQ
jgi:hypothetical protein